MFYHKIFEDLSLCVQPETLLLMLHKTKMPRKTKIMLTSNKLTMTMFIILIIPFILIYSHSILL